MEINIKVDYKAVEEVVRRAGMMIKEAHLSARRRQKGIPGRKNLTGCAS